MMSQLHLHRKYVRASYSENILFSSVFHSLLSPVSRDILQALLQAILSYTVGSAYLGKHKFCSVFTFSFLQSLLAVLDLVLAGCRPQLFPLMGQESGPLSAQVSLFINTASIQAVRQAVMSVTTKQLVDNRYRWAISHLYII